ncbi:TnsA endonuclease N-terminal domain-containing protein [Caulobacter endophyticus]|uniref:TnsA endonuclease N-terminal domain-containing protein n=1 Tax=Caulobacter endophyticus TaxID=2172652 RepID=UPI00240F6323|nr:TnsA endonuclease N-terminal domain-containing protein [Caulobacter endophyticus]MDG2527598.1 hypothetical protein [Caulobacter endophyticus]
MNIHTTDWQNGQSPGQTIHDELKSSQPSLLDALLAPLSKPGRDTNSRPLLPSATVVLAPDGSAIRSVLTGRRVMVTGFYNSRKAGRALPYEGMNELALLKHCEVDTTVVDYRSQPFRFEFVIDGAKRIYIADCVRLLDDGTVEVLEAKGRLRQLLSPDYAEKLDAVRDACTKLGWRLRVLSQKQLFEPHQVYANVDQIQSRRMVRFDQVDAYRALEHIEQEGGQTTLGRLAGVIGAGPRGLAISQAMMVRRLVKIDLSSRLSAESCVSLITHRPGEREAFR